MIDNENHLDEPTISNNICEMGDYEDGEIKGACNLQKRKLFG